MTAKHVEQPGFGAPYHSDRAVERWVQEHPEAIVTIQDGLREETRAADALWRPRAWETHYDWARRVASYDAVSRAMRRHGVPWCWVGAADARNERPRG